MTQPSSLSSGVVVHQHDFIREHAEAQFAHELAALQEHDQHRRPDGWILSPWAVVRYLMGGVLSNGVEISPKYFGSQRLMEVAVATLVTDRALLLVGVPGTGKSWVSEHLAAAICGDSTLLIQGTAGMGEEAIRYGWNYAELLAKGPSANALVESPLMRAMKRGQIARVEELTRIPSDVQDTLITVLSEKALPVAELNLEIQAKRGFNLIATANDRDRGVNELSSALKRRFNTVILPTPTSVDEEVMIVRKRVAHLGMPLNLPQPIPADESIRKVVTIFRELRHGITLDGLTKLKQPSAVLSAAEAISVMNQCLALSSHFGSGEIVVEDIASAIKGAIIRDQALDEPIWREYLDIVMKERQGWADLYAACRQELS